MERRDSRGFLNSPCEPPRQCRDFTKTRVGSLLIQSDEDLEVCTENLAISLARDGELEEAGAFLDLLNALQGPCDSGTDSQVSSRNSKMLELRSRSRLESESNDCLHSRYERVAPVLRSLHTLRSQDGTGLSEYDAVVGEKLARLGAVGQRLSARQNHVEAVVGSVASYHARCLNLNQYYDGPGGRTRGHLTAKEADELETNIRHLTFSRKQLTVDEDLAWKHKHVEARRSQNVFGNSGSGHALRV